MDNLSVIPIILTVITAATPLVFAALGELVVEKSGVLNLGVEGLMLIGAVAGFATATLTGSATIGVFAAIIAGAALSMIFAVIVLQLRANQVATGLALTLFGTGLAALIGQGYVGFPVEPLPRIAIPLLADIPVVGPILFHHDPLVFVLLVPEALRAALSGRDDSLDTDVGVAGENARQLVRERRWEIGEQVASRKSG